MNRRHLALHGPGKVLVNTDVHGNWEDFARLEQIYDELRQGSSEPVHWVVLGDLVHGPSQEFRHRAGDLYDYDDESARIVARMIELLDAYPDHVHFVLGNHDYAHIGGRVTAKFHPHEPEWLEAQMTPEAITRMHALFQNALLAISTPCGVFMCHGAPGLGLESLAQLEDFVLPARGASFKVIEDMLYAYGQPEEVIDELCERLSSAPDYPHTTPLQVVIHGHDRDEDGYFFEGDNQVCPVIFGAPRHHKRYVLLDLSRTYRCAEDVGEALHHLYPS